MRRALDDGVDAIIVSGGVWSAVRRREDRDRTIGRIDLWRVAVQPGKACRDRGTRDGRPALVFGPAGLELRDLRAIRAPGLAARRPPRPLRAADKATLEPVRKSHGRRAFIRVIPVNETMPGTPLRDADGRVKIRLAGGQESCHSALAKADALAIIPQADRATGRSPGCPVVAGRT